MEQKKFIYEQPQMEVYEMETAQVLCNSVTTPGEDAPSGSYDDED